MPKENAKEGQIQHAALQPASNWRRFFNFLLDFIFYNFAAFVMGIFLALAGLGEWTSESSLGSYLLASVLLFLYYLVFEATLQRTPGKLITGTKVVTTDGSRPTLGTIALRTLSRWVPFEPLSMYTGKEEDKKHTRWHDRWTRTRVVRT